MHGSPFGMIGRARGARLPRAILGATLIGLLFVGGAALALSPVPIRCDPATPCLAVRNLFLRADISELGTFTLGTTGGDPATMADDDKALLYDFRPGGQSDVGTGYPTIHFARAGTAPVDFTPRSAGDVVQQAVAPGNAQAVTVWRPDLGTFAGRITQTLALKDNPFTGRSDTLSIRYAVRNEGTEAAEIGIRSLLDIRMGRNDGAPYFVPGAGTVTHETAYRGDDVPPYWVAFESNTYDPAGLRAIGLIDGGGSTRPDAMWIVRWLKIANFPWDYAIDATAPVTQDSAIALLWEPELVPPGGERSVETNYGLAGDAGGLAFLVAPVTANCGGAFVISLFISNFDIAPLTGGMATVTLPTGIQLAAGDMATKPLPTILPGSAGSVSWSVVVAAGATGAAAIAASARFDGDRVLSATSDPLTLSCAPPTSTASPSPTTPPLATPTTTVGTPAACAFIFGRVPPTVIADALANPAGYQGWGQRVNPGLPPSPANPLRLQLSLHNIAIPYSPINNTVRWKGGCP